jgi:hypothetical protein
MIGREGFAGVEGFPVAQREVLAEWDDGVVAASATASGGTA